MSYDYKGRQKQMGCLGLIWSEAHELKDLRKRTAGVAEYVVDPKTGKTTFQFKKP